MKQADEAIDRVLAGLRDSEAPAGMEGRILQAMQARVAAEPVEKPGLWSWPRMAGCGALLAGLLVVVAVLVPHRGHTSGQERVVAKQVAAAPAMAAEPPGPVMQARVRDRLAEPVLIHAKRAIVVPKPDVDSNAVEDALAQEEMLAPSHPAPPLPMTAQEKLLVRAVRRHDPDELAMLNPEEQKKVEAKDEAAFKFFFGIPDAAKPEPQDGTGTKDVPSDAKPPEPEAQAAALAGK